MSTPTITAPSPVRCTPTIRSLLQRLHAQSAAQEAAIKPQQYDSIKANFSTDPAGAAAALDDLMLDKFIALEEDKAHFIYTLLLAQGATVVVEAGTSFGVSTIYWALAVGRNVERLSSRGGAGKDGGGGRAGGKGVVIGTEKEESKAAVARTCWNEAGPEVHRWIDLRVGDLTETLKGDLGLAEGQQVDFLLLDSTYTPSFPFPLILLTHLPSKSLLSHSIVSMVDSRSVVWSYMALPALKMVLPNLRPGALVVTDNVVSSAQGYAELFKVLRDPGGPFRSVTLPFKGGLEMSVYDP